MHARWILFINTFQYVLYHKSSTTNQVADALSRKSELLLTLQVELQRFESLKDQYATDKEFSTIWEMCNLKEPVRPFHISKGYLFHGNQLCIL